MTKKNQITCMWHAKKERTFPIRSGLRTGALVLVTTGEKKSEKMFAKNPIW